jgi:hypothetical protein
MGEFSDNRSSYYIAMKVVRFLSFRHFILKDYDQEILLNSFLPHERIARYSFNGFIPDKFVGYFPGSGRKIFKFIPTFALIFEK